MIKTVWTYLNGRTLKAMAFAVLLSCVFIMPAAAQSEPDITTGLVGHWKLDETSGTGIIDYASNNDGTVQGGLDPSTDSVNGRLGAALDFDGTNDYIDIPTTLPTGDFTYAVWINPNTLPSGSGQKIFSAQNNSGGDEILLGWEDNNTLEVQINNGVTFNNAGKLAVNQWDHLALTRQGSTVTLYQNGNEIGNGTASATLNFNGCQLLLGADNDSGGCTNNVNDFFDGIFDDLRIYNRALTAEDITYLYQSFDGNLVYDTDTRVPKYFNGEDWVAMGPSKYIPNAVVFSGSTNLLNTSAAGYSDSDAFNIGFWVKPTTEAADFQVILNADTGAASRFTIALDNGANNTNDLWTVYFESRNSSGALVAEYESAEILPANQWSHVLISVDASESEVQSYINDTLDTYYIAVNPGNGDINFNVSEYGVGEFAGTGDSLIASLADLYFETDSYIDLSIEANRRKFIDENGDPVYLGSDGSLPTDGSPDIFLSGDVDSWHTNKGTGGGFTENGALTDAMISPGMVVNADLCNPINSPTSGAACDDGTYFVSASMYSGGASLYMADTNSEVSRTWNNGTNNWFRTFVNSTTDGAANTQSLAEATDIGAPYAAALYCATLSAHGHSDWYLPAIDELALIYNGGAQIGDIDTVTTTPYWSSSEVGAAAGDERAQHQRMDNGSIGSVGQNKMIGRLVRCVRTGYVPSCSNPAKPAGSIVYNADSQVIQYCDGEDWQAMGPVPGDGTGGCSNPTRAEGSMVFNKDFSVMQYCEGDEWVSVGKVIDPCASNPSPGDVCLDGSVYAGLSPDGNVPMYTTPADAPGTYTWNDGNFTYQNTAMVDCYEPSPGAQASCQTGETNTAFLIGATGEPDYPFAAAEYCAGLSVHGNNDWYLPAMDELNVLYNNRDAIGGFNLVPTLYWTSSEQDNSQAVMQRFTDGYQGAETKAGDQYVRCVRKD